MTRNSLAKLAVVSPPDARQTASRATVRGNDPFRAGSAPHEPGTAPNSTAKVTITSRRNSHASLAL
ncbi:hypothetical protein MSTO_00760 [Mycobacterium stomatepiae]|uniref:Uncharacterized protein n=1 Tax=Mycobacterium stomatepiae TaxID=470076 RepID=A0A7I7Q162_9MYCO|nr:hypothetical protein MSTO_00760 [Mycobacterium stomatepiae]